MAYREPPRVEIACPRCKKKKLPPTEVAACDCGVWVTMFAASVVLSARDVRPDPVTRWWRVREPCPVCKEQMALCGDEPGLLQGCPLHGYWIDADTITHTTLAAGVDHAALDAKRTDEAAVAAERERLLKLEQARDRDRAEKERGQRAIATHARAAATGLDRENVGPDHAGRPSEHAFLLRAEQSGEILQPAVRRRSDASRERASVGADRANGNDQAAAATAHALALSEVDTGAALLARVARLEEQNAHLEQRVAALEAALAAAIARVT